MSTFARVRQTDSARWYLKSGEPLFEVPYADPKKGMRTATLADARKVGALPSVTSVLRVLARPELLSWIVEQAVLAVLTSPRREGERDDEFVNRVLSIERVQDQERDKAAETGRRIHAACNDFFRGTTPDPAWADWIKPVTDYIQSQGEYVCSETVLVGPDYAGTTDLVIQRDTNYTIIDYKTTKRLPTRPWPEHRLQLSAYANALHAKLERAGQPASTIKTANIYISTEVKGEFICLEHTASWAEAYTRGFRPTIAVWQYMNNYYGH